MFPETGTSTCRIEPELKEATPLPPAATAYGALLAYATDSSVADYQPMHVNFGIMESLDPPVRNKRERYKAYAQRGEKALQEYARALSDAGLLQGGE